MPEQFFLDALLSVAMMAVVALIWGGVSLYRRGSDRRRATLMLLAALVLFGNILVWTWPV